MLRLAFYILTLFEVLLLLTPIACTNSRNSPSSNYNVPSSSPRQEESESSSSSDTVSPAAFIISTVDGVLYTLDAYHGTLRGMFQSGPALVSQSTSDDFPNNSGENQDIDIIPGLDGSLYSYHSHELHQLPIRVHDLLTGPISTCFDSTCAGVVMGQSTKKLIAVDPISGTVKWMHEADLNGHGFHSERHSESTHRDDTTENRRGKGNKTVLLQREDYNVKHVDIHTGAESWAVHLGSIQALDLGSRTDGDNGKHSSGQDKYSHHEKGRISGFDLHSNILPGSEAYENRNVKNAHTRHAEFSLFESNHPGPFPSIAFGEDGTTVFGIDSTTNNVVWKRRFESIVASVYGVDSDAKWIDLNVLDIDDLDYDIDGEHDYEFLPSISSESEDDLGTVLSNRQHDHDRFMSEYLSDTSTSKKLITLPLATSTSSTVISNDIPYLQLRNSESFTPGSSVGLELTTCDDGAQLTKIGIEGSAIFVAPPKHHRSATSSMTDKFQIGAPRHSLSLPSKESVLNRNSNLHNHEKLSLPSSDFFEENGLGEYEDFAKMYARLISLNMSHKTEHGLFLTWKMVILLSLSLMAGIAGGRFFYMRNKQAWIENSPAILSLPNNSQLHHTPLQRQPLHMLGGEMQELNLGETSVANTEKDNFKKKIHASLNGASTIPRSASLPQLNKFLSGSIEEISTSPSVSMSKRGRSNTDDAESLIPTVAVTNASMTGTLNNGSSVTNQSQTKANDETTPMPIGGVSTIDGIPFYRYTRYQSEFHEKMQLGEGGFGTVFKCINTLDKREYAVKKVLLRSGLDSNGHLPEQFTQKLHRVLREVKILALLDHPNIVRYCTAWLELEIGDDDGESPTKTKSISRGFSSEYLVGSTLGNESLSPTRDSSHSHLHRSIFEVRDSKVNPLQWNNFSFVDNDQFDIPTTRKLVARESSSSLLSGSDDDIGFSWDRSPITSSNHKVPIKKSDGLATIEDSSINLSDDKSNSTSSNQSSSSSNDADTDSNTNWSDGDSKGVIPLSEEKTLSPSRQKEGDPGNHRTHTKTHKYVLYIQMQLCLKTLQDYMRSRGNSIDIPSALRLFSQIARGMQFVHEKGLIHRDLKPA